MEDDSDTFHGAANLFQIPNVAAHKLEPVGRVRKPAQILFFSGAEVVQDANAVSFREQTFGYVASYEAGASSDQYVTAQALSPTGRPRG